VPLVPKKWAARWIIKKAVKYANRCDQIIVPTESVRPIIEEWGVTNKNIQAIPTGIEEKFYQDADGNSVRQKYGIKDDETVLLLVSRLTEEKNVEFLFDAITPVLKKNKKIKFLVAGDGYLKPKLEKILQDNNLSSQVIFAGIVSKEEIKNYYAAGDIFVYASKSETQGMIISEAMYMGLPIVAVSAPGVCDLVENNQSGFLVPEDREIFSQTVQKLIGNENLRRQFSEKSKIIAREKYTAKVCAEKMMEVYKKAINTKLSS